MSFFDDFSAQSLETQEMQILNLVKKKKKTEVVALNTTNRSPIQVENIDLPYTDRFTYLGSIISSEGGTDLDIQSRLNKARSSLNMMSKVWRSSTYSIHTKLKLDHSCVHTSLLYGSECWRLTEKGLKCPYDQIFDFHFFTFSCTIRPSYSSCQISIHYEHQKSFYFNIYFREFTAAINQPCSKAWLRMGESDVKDSNIPHGLKL